MKGKERGELVVKKKICKCAVGIIWLHAYIWSGKLCGICGRYEDHGTVVCAPWTGICRSAADTPLSGRQEKSMVEMKVLSSHEEWLKARTKIGGSDASAIVGMNPYKSNVELWKEKAYGIEPVDISDKPYVKYGTEAEPLLRELFKLDYPEYQVCYEENNIWFNDKYPWAHASLDGWLIDQDGRKGIWECKTTNILQSMQKEKWDHRIPDNYYIQVLHYLMVTEFDFVILKAQLKSVYGENVYLQTRHYPIERSEVEEDIKYLIEKESKFWEHVQMKKAPALKLPEI